MRSAPVLHAGLSEPKQTIAWPMSPNEPLTNLVLL
jgi:hypothetical protein